MEAEKTRTHSLSFLLAGLLIVVFTICLCVNMWFGTSDESTAELQGRINPNTATVGSLMRLPQVGRVRAIAIVDYRRDHGPDTFECCADMQKVRGIGPVVSHNICDFLRFE
jgi:competence ComEA-like helix-hairpin-helix protein